MNKKESLLNVDTTQDPIYYNLTLNKGYNAMDNTGFNTPANFQETNSRPFLENTGDYYIAIMRTTIPTSNIPKYIYPIQTKLVDDPNTINTNINLTYNTFTFKYATAPNTYFNFANTSDYQLTAEFQPEILNALPKELLNSFSLPYAPSENDGLQDVRGFYYFVYSIQTFLNIYNTTLTQLFETFKTQLKAQQGTQLPDGIEPYFTYDDATQLFSFNAENTYFNSSSYPRIEVYIDGITNGNTLLPVVYNVQSQTPWDQYLIMINNNVDNNFVRSINSVNYTFLKMSACQSAIPLLASFQKIVFEISGDLSLKYNESDAIPLQFGQSTTSLYQKPEIPMLTDIEVNRDQWAVNNSFIQFQASSIEQVRLISLTNKSFAQNFNLRIYWVDNYGNKRTLEIPSLGNPLTIKLAFFKKKKI